ncbi:MAG TPA: formate dehydrogenase [Rhabdaerophilum sp.]|nr:formate dehydrogenase [Rhabdaerophilum sp.]
MSTKKEQAVEAVDRSRRGFLRAGLVGASAAAGASAVVAPAAASETEAEQKKARYKETDHVKKYYATNRY